MFNFRSYFHFGLDLKKTFAKHTVLSLNFLIHCKPIPVMKNRVFPVKTFSQRKTCFHYREPCSHCRDPCNENGVVPVKFFITGMGLQCRGWEVEEQQISETFWTKFWIFFEIKSPFIKERMWSMVNYIEKKDKPI